MKVEDLLSRANLADVPELPDNFARNVIVKARAVRRRRRVGGRIAAGVAVLMLVAFIPLAGRVPSPGNLSSRGPDRRYAPLASNETLVAWRAAEDTDALRLAAADTPGAVGDYLMPDTTALRQFASGYSDASWDYDPN